MFKAFKGTKRGRETDIEQKGLRGEKRKKEGERMRSIRPFSHSPIRHKNMATSVI